MSEVGSSIVNPGSLVEGKTASPLISPERSARIKINDSSRYDKLAIQKKVIDYKLGTKPWQTPERDGTKHDL